MIEYYEKYFNERLDTMAGLLGEILLEAGEITRKQLNEALELQKVKGGLLGEILAGLGYINNKELKEYLENQRTPKK